jgi:hypothetical protein
MLSLREKQKALAEENKSLKKSFFRFSFSQCFFFAIQAGIARVRQRSQSAKRGWKSSLLRNDSILLIIRGIYDSKRFRGYLVTLIGEGGRAVPF